MIVFPLPMSQDWLVAMPGPIGAGVGLLIILAIVVVIYLLDPVAEAIVSIGSWLMWSVLRLFGIRRNRPIDG